VARLVGKEATVGYLPPLPKSAEILVVRPRLFAIVTFHQVGGPLNRALIRMSIFAETLIVLRAIESHLLGEQENSFPLIANSKRLLWYPFKFLKLGMAEKTKSVSLWSFLALAFLVVGAWFINNSGTSKTMVANFVFYASLLVPMAMVLFAVPSMYGASGISQTSVDFVAEHLRSRGFTDAKDLDLLKKSVKPFEERSRSRVMVLKWLVGLLWAGFMYFVSKSIEAAEANPASIVTSLTTATAMFFSVVVAYVVVWGYEASLDKLFRLVEFGCNDYSYALARSARDAGSLKKHTPSN
jgi:hypothetical protein